MRSFEARIRDAVNVGDRSWGQVEGRSSDVGTPSRRQKKAICWPFVKPSDGLEPSTPSLPSSNEAGTVGKAGKPRARKSRKKKESPEDE